MKVVGEEGTSIEDFIVYLKSDFLDSVYMQQNSFDPIDNSVVIERQKHIFDIIFEILGTTFDLPAKDEARQYFNQLRQLFLDFNGTGWQTNEFNAKEKELREMLSSKQKSVDATVAAMLKN